MRVDRILLQPHPVELGQELVGEAGLGEEPESGARVVDEEELRQLVTDALGAHDLEPVAQLHDRVGQRRVGLEAELRDEPRRAQHAQRVVEERHLGGERRAQATGREVGGAVERIDQLGLRKPQRHRVHGEVAAREVGLDVVGVLHLGLAALGPVHLGAERRDLDHRVVLATAHRAEPLALEPHRVGPTADDLLHRVGTRVGGEVDVGSLAVARHPVEERVAHAPAHEVALVARVGDQARASCCVGLAGSSSGWRRGGIAAIPTIVVGRGAEPAKPARASQPRRPRSATVGSWTLHLPAHVSGATRRPSRSSRSTRSSPSCGSTPSPSRGRGAGVLCQRHADRLSPPPRLEPPRPPRPRSPAVDRPAGCDHGSASRHDPHRTSRAARSFTAVPGTGTAPALRRHAGAGAGRLRRRHHPPHLVTPRSTGSRVRTRARRPYPVARPRVRLGAADRLGLTQPLGPARSR